MPTIPSAIWVIIAVIVIVIFLAIVVKSTYRIADPNEALIISGRRDRSNSTKSDNEAVGETLGFRIVTGRGTFVIPGIQTTRTLSLDLKESKLEVDCTTFQGIPLVVEGVVVFKVGDTVPLIADAARRFLGQENTMEQRVYYVFEGHLRAIIGAMTVEELIRDRNALTSKVRESSAVDMAQLGLNVDNLQITKIGDPTGYIKNLALPHIASVERDARIAQANAETLAAQAEQVSATQVAEAKKVSSIAQAGFRSDVDREQANADQAGPLARATAEAAVVEQQTRIAQLTAARAEQELQATVIKPANAQAEAAIARARGEKESAILTAQATSESTRLEGQARAEVARTTGEAEAAVLTAKGEAEGSALLARAKGLAANQEAVIAQQLAEKLPAIVQAIAEPLGHIGNLTVLDGTKGITDVFSTVLAEAGSVMPVVKSIFNASLNKSPVLNEASGSSREVVPASPEPSANGRR